MRKHARRFVVFMVAMIVVLAVAGKPTSGQDQGIDPKLPLFGTWILDVDKSSFNRGNRPNIAPGKIAKPTLLKWKLEPENGGIRQTHYDTPESSEPRVSIFYKFDGQEWKDPHGPGMGEAVLPWLVNPYTQIRHVYTKEKTTEWSLYVVSSDRKTLTVTAWDEPRPWMRNIQVFDRQE
jgi:hypothetical protein